jgi:hypothetical protein
MDASAFNPRLTKSNRDFTTPGCSDFATMAERELSAFFRTVTKLFGSEQAEVCAEDWLTELSESDRLPSSIREWRAITAKASNRLASRVTPSSLLTEVQSV